MRKYSICVKCNKKCDENLLIEGESNNYMISHCKKCDQTIFITMNKNNKNIKKEDM